MRINAVEHAVESLIASIQQTIIYFFRITQPNSSLSDIELFCENVYLLFAPLNVTMTSFSISVFPPEAGAATTDSGKVLAKQYRGLLFVHCCSQRAKVKNNKSIST